MNDPARTPTVEPDIERMDRVAAALREQGLDALLCAVPSHVLLLTGYWPVMANTVAVFTANKAIHLILPKDEEELAERTSAAKRTSFQPGSLSQITNSEKAIAQPLTDLVKALGLDRTRIGVESRGTLNPISYLSQFHYGSTLSSIVQTAFPQITLHPADELLATLSATKTSRELDRLRFSCKMARTAYEQGVQGLKPGIAEPEAAELFRSAYAKCQSRQRPVQADAFFFCMSGVNSATAHAAYARTRERTIESDDPAMIHCNSNAGGFWTDITRTYTCGKPNAKQTSMRAAILEARQAALARISAGVAASEVDKAARDVLTGHGFGENFKHATGHGVCFAAANHDAIPRVHPKSTDILEIGMTFNIEPAIYIDGYGGMRHCDVVAVTRQGAEVLTDFQNIAGDLEISG